MKKTKMTYEGQPCRKCGTPVVKRTHERPTKPDQAYWFEWWLHCKNCGTNYMVEAAKKIIRKEEL